MEELEVREVAGLLSRSVGVAASVWALPSVMLAIFFLLRWLQSWLQCSPRCYPKCAKEPCSPGASQDQKHFCDGVAKHHDAQLCWSEGFGRYKYCGLRPEPLVSTSPPVYSLTNLDIPIPELGSQERGRLDELAGRVADLEELACRGPGLGGHRTDQSTLLRFLRARNGKVAEAEVLLREAAQWRQTMDVDRVFSHWDLEAYERCLAPWWLSGGFVGFGKKGEPVAIERLGRCHFPNLYKALPYEVLLRFDILHTQRCIAALEEEALKRGGPMIPAIVVMDLDGFGWDQIQFQPARALARLVSSRNLLLTNTTGRIIIVRAPAAFSKAFSLFSYLLDPGVREKIEVCSGLEKSLEVLRKFIDDDGLPGFLCGQKTINGDPDCSTLLAPGGHPPQEAIDRLLALTTRDGVLLPAAKEKTKSSRSLLGDSLEDDLDGDELDAAKLRRRSRVCCGM